MTSGPQASTDQRLELSIRRPASEAAGAERRTAACASMAAMARSEEIERLRAEVAEWRRRAEVAEAVAAERLMRAETAERALRAAEAALGSPTTRRKGETVPDAVATGAAATDAAAAATDPSRPSQRRPASLVERWRRYTETIN